MRVPRKTQAPLTLPGTLSTAGHCDQSRGDVAIACTPGNRIRQKRLGILRRRFVRHGVDFHLDAGDGELAGYGGAGGLGVAEEFGVDFVHAGEILAVGEVDAALYYVCQGGAAAFEDALDVV